MTVSLLHLLSPQLRSVWSTLRSSARGFALPLILTLAVACLIGCYYAGDFVFAQLTKVDLISDLLLMKSMGFIFTFFTYVLLFSTLIASFTTHYLADDLSLLMSSPVPISKLFYARTISAWAQSSWMIFIFALPTLAACGAQFDAGWSFYVILTISLFLLTCWCVGVASIASLLLARVFPARRLQEALVFLAVGLFIYLYLQFNASQPDRFFREDGFKDLVALIQGLREVGSDSGVIGWSVRAIFATLPPSDDLITPVVSDQNPLLPLSYATLTVGATLGLGGLLARVIYIPGYWLCQEGIGKAGESRVGRARPRYARSIFSAMVRREWQIFWRSPSQWTQLLLVGSLGIVYVYNFKYFDALHSTGFFTTATLYTTHITLTGMVMVTLAARFLYPSVSVEGRAVWVLQSAPITARDLLASKVRWAMWPLLGLSSTLSLFGAWFTKLSLSWIILTLWSGWLLTFLVLGLSIGMGALSPRFNLPNPQMVSAGLGGISFMLLALLCTGIISALTFTTALGLMLCQHHVDLGLSWSFGIQTAYDRYYLWPLLGWLGAHLFVLLVYQGSMRFGAKRLEATLSHDLQVEG